MFTPQSLACKQHVKGGMYVWRLAIKSALVVITFQCPRSQAQPAAEQISDSAKAT